MVRVLRYSLLVGSLWASIVLWGWTQAAAGAEVRVVASIKPLHSLVSAIMQGVGEPRLLVRGSASPHTFHLRPSDARELERAEAVFWIGEGLETSLAGPISALAGTARVVALSEAEGLRRLPVREGGAFANHGHHHHEDSAAPPSENGPDAVEDAAAGSGGGHRTDAHDRGHAEGFDLHLWLDPANAGVMARVVAGVLIELDPARADTYAANLQALQRDLEELTRSIQREVAGIQGTPYVVFHDAYQYFENRFGLTPVASVALHPDRSPGARRIRELRDTVARLGVSCVFAEPQFEPGLVDTIIQGTSTRKGVLDPLGAAIGSGPELYADLLRTMAASFDACLSTDGEGIEARG